MKIFDKLFSKKENKTDSNLEKADANTLLKMHEEGLLDDSAFLNTFANATIFYSTPFGDHKDGGSRLFVLPAKDRTGYFPIFTSHESMADFYEKAGRAGFMIIDGTFLSCLKTIKGTNASKTPVKLGAIIDPANYGITIEASMIEAVIDMI